MPGDIIHLAAGTYPAFTMLKDGVAGKPIVKGVRPMLGFIEDTGWILRPEIQPALKALAREHYVYNRAEQQMKAAREQCAERERQAEAERRTRGDASREARETDEDSDGQEPNQPA